MASIINVTSAERPEHHPLRNKTVELGRSPECAVQLVHDSVSRHHARLVYDKASNSYTIMDLGSRNGTRVNGEALGEPRTLSDGDAVLLGSVSLRFAEEDFDDDQSAFERAMLEKWFGEDDRNTIAG